MLDVSRFGIGSDFAEVIPSRFSIVCFIAHHDIHQRTEFATILLDHLWHLTSESRRILWKLEPGKVRRLTRTLKPWPKIYWHLASLDSNLGFGMCLPMHVFEYLLVQNQQPWESNILRHKLFQTCSSWLSKLTATIPQLDSRYFGTHYTTCFL